jgi:hypothetical protein
MMTVKFTSQWWNAYCCAWNASTRSTSTFASLGSIIIRFSDASSASVHLTWDSQGSLSFRAVSSESKAESVTTFEAPAAIWNELISGASSAARLVVRGKISFRGSPSFLLAHGPKFDLLGAIGADMLRTSSLPKL